MPSFYCFTEFRNWPISGPSHGLPLCFLRSCLIGGLQTRTCKPIQFLLVFFCVNKVLLAHRTSHWLLYPVWCHLCFSDKLVGSNRFYHPKNPKISVFGPAPWMLKPGMNYKLSEDRGLNLEHCFICRTSHRASTQHTVNTQRITEQTKDEHYCWKGQGQEGKSNKCTGHLPRGLPVER